MTTAIAGFNKVLSVKTTGSTAGYKAIPGVTGNLSLGATLLEDTDFTSTGWKSRIAGLRDFSCAGDAIYDTSNTAVTIIRSAVLNGTRLNFKYLPDGTHGFTGNVLVEKMDHAGDVGTLEKFSFTLVADGSSVLTTV